MNKADTHVERARRFPTAAHVLWRPRGQTAWTEGTSLNISQSGILFQTDALAEVNTRIDFVLTLSDNARDVDVPEVLCLGRISRKEGGDSADGSLLLAATIDSYSFIRWPEDAGRP